MRGLLPIAATLCLLVGASLGVRRLVAHRAHEGTAASPPQLPPPAHSVRNLVQAPLHAGQSVTFEACAEPGFVRPDAFAFDVVDVRSGRLVLEAPIDAGRFARARSGNGVSCTTLGAAERLGVSSTYAILARGVDERATDLAATRLVGRIVANDHADDRDLLAIALSILGAVLAIAALARRGYDATTVARREHETAALADAEAHEARSDASAASRTALLVATLLFATIGLVEFVPLVGAPGGLVRAAIVAVVELAGLALAARVLAPGTRAVRLGLALPPRAALAYATTPFVGFALASSGSFLARLVPSTGIAPISTLAATTSGFLAVALVAVLAPVVEELFFRGALFGLVEEGMGANAATLASFLLFVVAHVPQAYGAWGSLVSIAWLGLVLTLVRRGTGSSLVPAAIHLVHNVAITLAGLAIHA